jgi:hypothetical protein
MQGYVGYEISSTFLVILTTFQILADRSAFRSMIKKKAAEVVRRCYDFYPTSKTCPKNQRQLAESIKSAIGKLVWKGHYLKGGEDEDVCANTLRQNNSNESAYRGVVTTCATPQSRSSRYIYTSLLSAHSQLNFKISCHVESWLWLQLPYVHPPKTLSEAVTLIIF